VIESPPTHSGRSKRGVTAIFVRDGSAADVSEGEMRVFDLSGTKVNVAHTADGLHAFDDTCTHMGCSLANGRLDGTVVTCACHGSQFDVTSGAVLRGPAQRPVGSFAVTVEDGHIVAGARGADR